MAINQFFLNHFFLFSQKAQSQNPFFLAYQFSKILLVFLKKKINK